MRANFGHAEACPSEGTRFCASPTSRSPSELGERAIDPRQNLFFAEDFEQMIEAWPGVAASHGESRWVDQRADFYTEICRSRF